MVLEQLFLGSRCWFWKVHEEISSRHLNKLREGGSVGGLNQFQWSLMGCPSSWTSNTARQLLRYCFNLALILVEIFNGHF